jgi:hypothetical protein
MKVTAGLLGLDTSTYLTAEADTLQTVTTRGATTTTVSTFSTAIKTPKIYPSADATTAIQVLKADGTTPVLNIDTTNKRLGVGTTAPMVALHSSDGATVANGIKAFWNDASDIMVSANQPTSGAGVRIAVAHNSTVTSRPVMTFIRTRGTLETPTTVQTDDNLGDLLFGGASSDGSIAYGAGVFAFADGTTTVGGVPTRLSFVTGSHSGNRAERLKIASTGGVTVTSTLGVTGATTLNGDLNLTKVTPVIVLTNNVNTAKSRISVYSVTPNAVYTTANAYFDGSNWQRDDTAITSVVKSLDAGSATVLERFRYSAAGSGAITLSTAYQVNTGGVFQVPKLSPISNSTTAMQFFKADGTTAVMTIDTTNSRVYANGALYLDSNMVTAASSRIGIGGAPLTRTAIFIPTTCVFTDTATHVYGLNFSPTIQNSNTSFSAVYADAVVGNGATITSHYGLRVQNPTKSGTGAITTLYGVYITAQSSGATNWGIYQAGTESNYFGGSIQIADKDFILGTTTGSKIGTATGQKLGFWNATPVVQQAHIADPTGGLVTDTEARAAIASINALLATLGLTASA